MSFPKVALQIELPTTAKDFLMSLERVGIEKVTKSLGIPLSTLGQRVRTAGDYFEKVTGWYEMQGLSFSMSTPSLKKLKPNKEIECPVKLYGVAEFNELDINNIFYTMSFRGRQDYLMNIHTRVVNDSGELVRNFFATDFLSLDFSRSACMIPTPRLTNNYKFNLARVGNGLEVVSQ